MTIELCKRESDGIAVSLYWNRETGETTIGVDDSRRDLYAVFSISPDKCLDAYSHPFAYFGDAIAAVEKYGRESEHDNHSRKAPSKAT